MGLFDFDVFSDPTRASMMGLASGLLSPPTRPGRQTFGEAFGVGLTGAMQAQQAARRQQMLEEELRSRRQAEELQRLKFAVELQQSQATQQRSAEMEKRLIEMDPSGKLLMAYRVDPKSVASQLFPQEKEHVLGAGARLVRGNQVLVENPKQPEQSSLAKLIAERDALPPNHPMRLTYDDAIKKATSHPLPASQNVWTGTPVAAEIGGQPGYIMGSKEGGYATLPGVQPPGSAEKVAKAEDRKRMAVTQAQTVIGKVDSALSMLGKFTTGFSGARFSNIEGTEAFNLARELDTIRSNVGFAALQAMREASPTGGALGQVAVQELAMLQAQLSSLDIGQGEAQLRQNLNNVKRHFENLMRILENQSPSGSAAGTGTQNVKGVIDFNSLPPRR